MGIPELILAAAIVLLLTVAPFLFARGHGQKQTETTAARAYLDRLFGPARRASLPTVSVVPPLAAVVVAPLPSE
jgi:hypothetical protein